MNDSKKISEGLGELTNVINQTIPKLEQLDGMISAMRKCLASGGTLFFAGNGGSAADAQHLATEYVVRYSSEQKRPVRAIALTTDSSTLTATGNDFGFEEIFARQLEALARRGDLLIVHSTSGNSTNLVRAVERAGTLGVVTAAMLGGDGGTLLPLVDHAFVVPDSRVNHIQEVHIAVQHQIASLLTEEFGS